MVGYELDSVMLNKNETCGELMATPKMELSDKLKQLIRELSLIENMLNDALYNICLQRYERDDKIPEPECHMQSINILENRVEWIQRIAERLNNELR